MSNGDAGSVKSWDVTPCQTVYTMNNSDTDHSGRSGTSMHGFCEGSYCKPQYGCLAFEEPSLADYQLKTYLPRESPTLNPLLAIASHQWFDRLFNTGPSAQSVHRPINERRYLFASQTPELSQPEYDMTDDNGNIPNPTTSKNVDKRVGYGSTEYKHASLLTSQTDIRNYASSQASFSTAGLETGDRQISHLAPLPCRSRVSNKSYMCESNSVFIKPPLDQFARTPFVETVEENDVHHEDHGSDTYKCLSASTTIIPDFTQKTTLSYPTHSSMDNNPLTTNPSFNEVGCRETVFIVTSADGTLTTRSPDTQVASEREVDSTMVHVRPVEHKIDKEPLCSPKRRKELAITSTNSDAPNVMEPIDPTVTQTDIKTRMYQLNLSTCDMQSIRMADPQVDWNESRQENDDPFHSSPSNESESHKGNNIFLGLPSYASHTGSSSLEWHQDRSEISKMGPTHVEDWSGSSVDLMSSDTFPVMNVLPCISQGLLSSFTNPYNNQPPAMGGDSQSFPMHTSHCANFYPNSLDNYSSPSDCSVLPHQFHSLSGQSIPCAPLLNCPTDPNTMAAAAIATNFPNSFNYHMLPPVGGLTHSSVPTAPQSHSSSYQTNRSRVGTSSFPPNILSSATGGQYVQRTASNSYSLSGPPTEVDYNPRELEAFSELFKQRRIKLGVTQADVGKALGNLKIAGVGSLSQSTICRFESLTLSHNNMVALKPVLQAWLDEAEADAAERSRHPEIYDPEEEKRRKRTSITDSEKRSLEAFFSVQPRPSSEKISQIAEKLNLRKNVVRVWFCNQRQKQKRMKFSTLGLLHHAVSRS
ncbi:POU domain protein [Fasciola hepatica]|uniref:POU domain protein n=1 Tax=Fasciola hepatica TaxID=6192 RepID=A0A4E0RLZ3_FASHE|nr:POU domain protein [Fasciola hepatica]